MKIKQANSYALHALMYMVRHVTQLPVTVHSIAKAEGIPYRQLINIFQTLSEAGIVKGAPGGQSGYVFAKPPSEISLYELIELIEEEPIFRECFMNNCDCNKSADQCQIYALWKQSTASVAKKLSEITLDNVSWEHPEHHF